jgi:hypothetical protein
MFPISDVLTRVLVAQFYKQNSGLLLFIFFVMFGMVEGSQLVSYHLSLMTGIVQSPTFLALVLLLWLVYAVKSALFVGAQLSKPQNTFLYALAALPRASQLVNLFAPHLLIHLPVWFYAMATSFVAINQGKPTIALLIIAFNISVCMAMSWVSVRKLNHPGSFSASLFSGIKLPFRKPLFWFYLGFIMSDALLILIITKLFSYFVLLGFFQIPLDHYENRIPLMGLPVGIVAHAVLVYEIRKWEDNYLSFARNLPIKLSDRYFALALVYLLLITPEILLLITNHVHLIDCVGTIAFGVGLLLFFHPLLYHLNMNMDRYIQYVLITFLLSFALILFKLSWLLVPVYIAISLRMYKKYFYSFEAMKL